MFIVSRQCVEKMLVELFRVEPNNLSMWTPTEEILQAFQDASGYTYNCRSGQMILSVVADSINLKRHKRRTKNGKLVWGYDGVERIS